MADVIFIASEGIEQEVKIKANKEEIMDGYAMSCPICTKAKRFWKAAAARIRIGIEGMFIFIDKGAKLGNHEEDC